MKAGYELQRIMSISFLIRFCQLIFKAVTGVHGNEPAKRRRSIKGEGSSNFEECYLLPIDIQSKHYYFINKRDAAMHVMSHVTGFE
jgi:hypothetical protein